MKLLALAISLLALSSASCSPANPHNNATPSTQPSAANHNQSSPCVNLNRASAEELKALPEIGEVMAQRIIEYRKRHAGFRRPQELIILEGFSEKKYRAIANLVCVE